MTGIPPFADIAAGAMNVHGRLEHCVSDEVCDTVEEVENYHDRLVDEMQNLSWLVHRLADALATEAQRAETLKDGSVHEGAGGEAATPDPSNTSSSQSDGRGL